MTWSRKLPEPWRWWYAGVEGCYTGAGEAPGYWWGRGLGAIGLERGALVADLRALLPPRP